MKFVGCDEKGLYNAWDKQVFNLIKMIKIAKKIDKN
jgi:hypothetical protein